MKRVLLKVGGLVQSAQQFDLSPGYLVFEGDRIVAAGLGSFKGDSADCEVIDRPRCVAIPGLVNTHGHAAMTLLRGAGDDMPLMNWLNERIFPLEAKLTEQAIYWGTTLAAWEMIQSGTTCFTDMYFFMNDAAKAVADTGLRAVLSWGMVGLDDASKQAGIRNSRSFIAAWNHEANGRITTTLGPHAPYTCPPDYLRQVAELSHELGVAVQIHLSETSIEVQNSREQHNMSPIELVHACGLLERPVLAAHCVHVSPHDIALMKQHGVHVAHNPQSNLKLGSGVAPLVQMLKAGLTVGLGTDGAASNNNLDMFEELRLAATLHKGVMQNATVVPAHEAFYMATEGGAKCVFLKPGHGTLTPGAAADVTLLSMDSPHFIPNHNLLSNIVYAAGADDVADVFVAGKQLMSNREVLTIDVERMRYEVHKLEQILKS